MQFPVRAESKLMCLILCHNLKYCINLVSLIIGVLQHRYPCTSYIASACSVFRLAVSDIVASNAKTSMGKKKMSKKVKEERKKGGMHERM